MTVTSIRDAWAEVQKIFPTRYEHDASITDCIAAVNILVNMEEDVDDWMIAGINAMLDKVRVTRGIPFDLSTAICGVLGAQYR